MFKSVAALLRDRASFNRVAAAAICCGFDSSHGRSCLTMVIAIIDGIAGLSLAMNLHDRGIAARVFERAPEIRELGVGITLLPDAMREFAALGLRDQLVPAGE